MISFRNLSVHIVIETLKDLGKPGTPEFRLDQTAIILREMMVDFLYRFKDKHPYSIKVFVLINLY